MGKKPIFRKSKSDPIILNLLRKKTYSHKELLDLNNKKESPISKIPRKTLRRRLKQLETYGYIEHRPDAYKIAESFEEANPKEVEQCIQLLELEDNENVLHSRISQLRQISAGKRIAHLPRVILCLSKLLERPQVIGKSQLLREVFITLDQIANFEQQYKSPDSARILERLTENTEKSVLSIINEKAEFPDGAVIRYLGKISGKEAIDTLFDKIKQYPHQARNGINDLGVTLGKKNLYKKCAKLINKHLDELIRSDIDILSKFGTDLRKQIL